MDFWVPVCLKGVGEAVIWEEVWVTLSENFVAVRQRNKDALIIIIKKGPANKRQPLLLCWPYCVKKAVAIKKS